MATTYGRYATRFTYSNGFQANATAARNQMLNKLKPRPKVAAASTRRRRRADSQTETADTGEDTLVQHAHVAPHDEPDRQGGGQGGRQQRNRDDREDEAAPLAELPRVRAARGRPAPAPAQRALRSTVEGLADASERERALRHLWADSLLRLGRRLEADPAARITPALLGHGADLLAARLRAGPCTPIGWEGVKQLLLDATRDAAAAPREARGASGERARAHFLLLPLMVFNAERPSTTAQLERAFASVETLRGGVSTVRGGQS
ncbi:type III secretion system protein [Burkholderia alba]|uniref:type III secretion system protein n=1 Tax=Burkholderia alba TaxID=2683677 RepID=UPI002B056DB5|nr:type III secretion system protein [Burkholderia alba]